MGAGVAIGRLPTMVRAALQSHIGRRRALIVFLGTLVCAYAAAVLWYVMSSPEIGIHFSLTEHIYDTDPDFFHPESRADGKNVPEKNDQVVQLGSQVVTNSWALLVRKLRALGQEDYDATYKEGTPLAQTSPDATHILIGTEDWVRVRFHRAADETHEGVVWCRVGRPPIETVIPSILWFFIKGGLFLVGALVFWKRPDDRSAMQFFLLCIVTFNAYMGGYHWQQIATQPILLLVFIASAVLLPAVSLHFYLLFPRPKAILLRRPRMTLTAVYALPALFLVAILGVYFQIRDLTHQRVLPWSDGLELEATSRFLKHVAFVYFGVAACWYLACVVSLVHSFRFAANTIERNQVKWILFGASAALVPIGYTLYLAIADQPGFGAGKATWPMFLASVIFTAAFAVAITRYRLMQLDQLIGSGVIYFLISSVFGLVYYALIFTSMWLVGNHQMILGPVGQALGVSGTVLLLLIVFDLIRSRLKKALDHHFRREKFQLDRTLRRMSQAIEQLVDQPTLARRLLHTSADLLGASQGAVYLREGTPPLYRLADHIGPAPTLTELSHGCPLIEALRTRGTLLSRSRFVSVDPAQRQLQFIGGELAHAVAHEGAMLALLVLGPRDGGLYSADDLNLLGAFAQMTALALVSAEGHHKIDSLNRDLHAKIDKIAEQQRRITTLQSQLLLQERVQSSQVVGQRSLDDSNTREAAVDENENGSTVAGRGFVGSSAQVRQLLNVVRKVAASPSAVLLRGESGTGKELLARALHEASPRASQAFVKVHCAALSSGVLESELFGHVKGAFTGAHRDKTGRFELAHGGTLFLDEIGDITLDVQTKLLRVLQEMTFERVGSSEPVEVDVRLVTATHQDLEALIRQGRFREDLYYRLNVISITVPPLRDRREDIVELAHHFLCIYSQRSGKQTPQLDDDALSALKSYDWPGNIRQLENVIERAVVIAEENLITPIDLAPEILPSNGVETKVHENGIAMAEEPSSWMRDPAGERSERDRVEREHLVRALAGAAGNKAEAARALGLARSTFFSKLKKHGLS
jgi:transcriptional regulator with GAF, ATPase, and Fis domain